jgi:hypothetical protein
MSFSLADLLNFSNVLLIPAVIYIVKLERRLAVLETRLESLLTHLEGCK